MAKTRIDFKSIPTQAQKPLYAGVGAGDLAVTAVKEYVADVQKLITGYQKDAQTKVADVQKTVTGFDPKTLRASALDAAKTRRSQVEARVAELQAEATALPTKVQSVVAENVATVTDAVTGAVTTTYADLAKRGEAVVKGTKLPSSASVEVKVNPTHPGARTATPATKATATKAPAKKATAKKSPARKPAAKKSPAKKAAAPQA